MSSSPTTADEFFSQKAIQKALKVWHDSKKLAKHPLTRLEVVTAERQMGAYSETPAGYGLALRQVLEQAIETLKPSDQEPDYLAKPWRGYLILTQRYIEGYSPRYIRQQLGIAERTFRNEQGEAFSRLADTLRLREREEAQKAAEAEEEEEQVVLNVPFLAPPKPTYALIGRDQILVNLKQRLFRGDSVALFALNGLPGVGKTALSIALAHDPEVLAHFSDGVLWAGLGREPDLLSLLNVWALALGISASDIGTFVTIKQKARGIQAAIGMRRMLLVIDDAWQSPDALAFQLGGPNCAHILTTRQGCVAWDFAQEGARAVQELNEADSLALLSQFVPQVVINQPQEARTLVKAVGGLPLALTLMGNYLRKSTFLNPSHGLQAALDALQQTEERLRISQHLSPLAQLPTLAADVPLSLLASIEISDNALEQPARHALRALATFPPKPNSFSQEAALTVSDKPLDSLNHLTEAGLLETSGSERYTLHQTISDYARTSPAAEGCDAPYVAPTPSATSATSWERAATYFAAFAQEHSESEGYPFLDADWQNVSHFMQWAYEQQRWQPLIEGVEGLTHHNLGVVGFMDARGHWNAVRALLAHALEGANALNDPFLKASILTKLGAYAFRLADFEAAEEYLQQSLSLLNPLPSSLEVVLERSHLYEFMIWLDMQRDFEAAHAWIEQGLSELDALPSQTDVATHQKGYLHILSSRILRKTGQLQKAIKVAEEGLSQLPSSPTPARIHGLMILNNLFAHLGEMEKSITYQKEGIQIAQQLGDSRRLAMLWNNMGLDEGNQGNLSAAVSSFQKALQLHRQMGSVEGQAKVHSNLGMFLIVFGEDEQAKEHLTRAIHLTQQHNLREDEAFAQTQLASLLIYQDHLAEAAAALKIAHSICQERKLAYLLAVVLYWQAELQRLMDEQAQGVILIDKSLQLSKERGYLLEEGIAWSIKGKILDGMERFDEAEAAHQTSLRIIAEQYPYDLAQSKLAFGEHYKQRARSLMRDTQRAHCGELYPKGTLSQRAKSWLEEALATFERLGAKREIAKARGLLGLLAVQG